MLITNYKSGLPIYPLDSVDYALAVQQDTERNIDLLYHYQQNTAIYWSI